MEAKQRGRKRKQPPLNLFTGIFTRKKSQLFLHNSRSGKSRPDPLRKIKSFAPHSLIRNNSQLGKYQKSPHHEEEEDDDDSIYDMSIKDLRLRRVFSKPLIPKEPKSTQVGSLSEVESAMNLNPNLYSEPNDAKLDKLVGESVGFENSSEETRLNGCLLSERSDLATDLLTSEGENPNFTGENPNSSVVETCDRGVDFKGEGLSDENPNLLVASIRVSDVKEEISSLSDDKEVLDGAKEMKFDVGFNCIGKISNLLSPNVSKGDLKGENREDCEGFTEENVQTTPPEAVIHVQQSDDGSANGCSRSPPKKISPTKVKKNPFDSKRNMVLRPCSRMKVFMSPYSFSYRRLLPYLMDIANDTSCAPKVNPCPKTEIDAGEKPLVSSSQESIIDTPKFDEKPPTVLPGFTPQEVSISRKEDVKGSLELKDSDLKTEQAAIETPVDCSQDKSRVSRVSRQSKIENPIENDSHKGVLPNKLVAIDNTGTLVDVSVIVKPDQVDSSIAPNRSPEALKKDANIDAQCQLALFAERECRTAHVEFKTGESSMSVFHRPAKLEAVVSSGVSADCLAKGILKRNPRGCRGVCNCLNCASFRLNAGKAFEFSRNQMLDTQELVLDMMKELSNLRVMLKKSVDGSNNHAILPVDEVQEACKRASNMEDIARNRLSQMNEDLFVHCRTKSLERPRVKFSSYVEEKVIEKSTKQIHQNNASRSFTL